MSYREPINRKTIRSRFERLRRYVVVTTTGRSGSAFVADLVNKNALNASAEHEPDLVPVDTSTQWYYDGAQDKLADLAERKIARLRRGEVICSVPLAERHYKSFARSKVKRVIPQVPIREVYVEVDNGFLKSYGYALLDAISDLEFVHLTRDPLLQAKSAENRNSQPNPKIPYFLWPSWERNVFQLSDEVTAGLSKFQLALWYWFEMELRYVTLRESCGINPVMEVDIEDLNDRETAEALFARLGIRHRPLDLEANRNLGPRKTVVADRDREEALAFLELVPDKVMASLPKTYGLETL